MKYFMAAMLLGYTLFVSGCGSFSKTETILIGGERIVYYPAGKPVPYVRATDNTNGWYSLTAPELNALLNP